MWFFIYRLFLFMLFKPVWIYSKETIIIRTSEESRENAFVDVLKNITSANQILQDLIRNYEQLQKIYKSNEEDFSDDSDNDEQGNFKAFSSGETKHTTKGFRMTQMIYVGESRESAEGNHSGNQDDDSQVAAVASIEINVGPKLNNSVSPSDYYDGNENDSYEAVSPETLQPVLEIQTSQPSAFSSTDRKTRFNIKKTGETNVNLNTRNKTRFSIQYKNARPNFKRSNMKHTGDKIKRIVYAEVFSPEKIWHEVVHKPIELKIYNNRANFKIPNGEKPSPKSKYTFDKGKGLSDWMSDSNPEDEIIQKEEIKSILLREAYGDACLQVAVRKCYKALKAVKKTVCRLRFKCKSSLKGSFTENAKKGCIREFVNDKNSKDDAQEIDFERTINKNGGTDLSKYVELCLPHLRSEITNDRGPPKSTKDFKTINILRDKFEKACKKLSAKKCRKACKFAYETACSTHTCENSLKKGFKKGCKAECSRAYNLYKAESDSEDDEGDDSESESD